MSNNSFLIHESKNIISLDRITTTEKITTTEELIECLIYLEIIYKPYECEVWLFMKIIKMNG